MEKSEILTEELKTLLEKIEEWLVELYYESRKIPLTLLRGESLLYHSEYQKTIESSITHIRKIINKGHYTQNEKQLLNVIREMWISEQKARSGSI